MSWAAIGIAFKSLCRILHRGKGAMRMHRVCHTPLISSESVLMLHFVLFSLLLFLISFPNDTIHRYYLQFEARMGMRIYSDVAIDDFSMSPECFGLNIPAEHLQGYNYYDQRILQDKTPHEDFVNRTSMFCTLSFVFFLCFGFTVWKFSISSS